MVEGTLNMLGMLRRARERREERERNCPCKGTCDCHKPEPGLPHWAGTLFLLSPILVIVVLTIFGPLPPTPKRTIRVGAQVAIEPMISPIADQSCETSWGLPGIDIRRRL